MPHSLFHPKTLRDAVKAFRFPADLEAKQAIVCQWIETLAAGTLAQVKETSLHGEFLSDIFRSVLGYRGIVEAGGVAWELHPERNVGNRGGVADAALGLFTSQVSDRGAVKLAGRTVAPIELKGAAIDLDRKTKGNESAVEQGWRYANYTEGCRWMIVSNYRELRLYCTVKTPLDYERFELTDLADLETFKTFYFLLCRPNFLPESIEASTTTRIDQLLTESDEREQEITDQLYAEYKDVRQALVTFFRAKAPRNLKDRNTAIVSAAQKILDRVLFIAFCEDKGLLPRQTLKHATDYKDPYHPQDIWLNYTTIFRWVDVGHRRSPVQNQPIPGYNGGLFAIDPLVDETLTVPDWLCEKLSGLADYDYESEISVNILGHIFEQSVTDLEELWAFADGAIDTFDPKQGKRKRQGVFYTPEWVTRYMVETALGGYLDRQFVMLRERFGLGETLAGASRETEIGLWRSYRDEVLSTVRVLDPACGSGAFLIAAFEFLELQYRQVRSTLSELATGKMDDANNPELDRTLILRNNLFGVDLSAESVEITKLSLWLQTAEPGKKLTDLDRNIRVGNSIVAVKKYDKKAFKWEQEFSEILSAGGFDVVLGNPPYVRQEFLSAFKPYLQKQYDCYDGVADLYTYFYEQGFKLLKPGGVLSYIVTNKWLRAGYGEGLRRFFAERSELERIIDFGHAPIFKDADTFPCIVVLRKPIGAIGGALDGALKSKRSPVLICPVPREVLAGLDLKRYVEEEGFTVDPGRFSASAWSLEHPAVDALMAKIRRVGVPLVDFAGVKPFYGIKTGFNQAFFIDQKTKENLITKSPKCSEVIKPCLRGQDIGRWFYDWNDDVWLIEANKDLDISKYPEIKHHLEAFRSQLQKRAGQQEWWQWQASPASMEIFHKTKIIYQEIQFHSSFSWDSSGKLINNKCFAIPDPSFSLIAILSSPLMWWYNWRNLPHMKDDALSPTGILMTNLPISLFSKDDHEIQAEENTEEIIELTKKNYQVQRDLIDWLHIETNLEKSSRKLQDPTSLDLEDFKKEVKKCAAKGTTFGLKKYREITDIYNEAIPQLRQNNTEIRQLEHRLSDLVNQAYQLTPDEIALLWKTAPPRMPIDPPDPLAFP